MRAQRFDRVAGDAPVIGRVSRIPGTGLPRGSRKKRRHGEGKHGDLRQAQQKATIWVWSLVLALLAFGVIGFAVAMWIKSSKETSAGVERGTNATYPMTKRVTSRFESPSEEAALEWVKRALLVRDPAMIAKYFRLGTTDPNTVVSFLEKTSKTEGPITGYSWLSSMDRNGLLIDGVMIKGERGYSLKNRLALLTPDESGKWQIDYDAFARTCKPACESVLDLNYKGGLIRVFVARDRYYNSVFANDSEWACYRLLSPDWKDVLLGYCQNNTPELAAMSRVLDNARISGENLGAVRAILEIERVEGAEQRQFRITRVLAEDWVMSATPFDEPFK